MNDTYWTGELIGDTTLESYSHDDPDVIKDWLHDTIGEYYGLQPEGPEKFAAYLAMQELTTHDFDVDDEFNCEILGTYARICRDFD